MIETPWTTETTAQLAAVIHLTVPRHEIQSVMGPAIMEILATIKAQGLSPTGPLFTHHLKMTPSEFDVEVCAPVSSPITPSGRVVPREFPSVKVIRTIYHGPYEGLGPAWGEFMAWFSANGHREAPDLYEAYLQGPESGPDATQWRTELSGPIIG